MLIHQLNYLKNTMTSVATGGQRIQDVNAEYQRAYIQTSAELRALGIRNENVYSDLWEWYGKWSADMPTYQQRRAYVVDLFRDMIAQVEGHLVPAALEVELTGWDRIERSVGEIKYKLNEATTEERCQAIGLYCRETIISLAQQVFITERHPSLDGTNISRTDAKRMLDAYFAVELAGGYNEVLRTHARAVNGLSNELTHRRTATRKQAKLCASATISLVHLIRIMEEEEQDDQGAPN